LTQSTLERSLARTPGDAAINPGDDAANANPATLGRTDPPLLARTDPIDELGSRSELRTESPLSSLS